MQTIPRHNEAAPNNRARLSRWAAHGLFFAAFGLVALKTALPIPALEHTVWPEALLIVAAVASILGSLSGQVPFQNALFAAVVIALFGRVVQMIGELTGLPLGPFFGAKVPGPNLFNLPGAIPIALILSLLSSRCVAQLILRPWRRISNYGLWQLGLAATLALMFEPSFEAFVLRGNGHWLWQSTATTGFLSVHPLIHVAAFWVIALVLLVLSTPLLLKKIPMEPPPALQPLAVWTSLMLLFVVSSVTRPLWLAAALCCMAAVALLAIRGGRS